jgi:SAM-dependent methyltransferase
MANPAPAPNAVASLFDTLSPTYHAAFSDLTHQHTAISWVLSALSALPSPAKIIDLGCGPGDPVVSTLASAGHTVLGTDISAGMITEARRRVPHPNASFLQLDTLKWEPEEGEYDAVVLMFSLIIDVSIADIRETIAKVYRAVKPGGVFMFATVAIGGDEVDIVWLGRPITCSSLSPTEVVERMEEVGFEVVKTEETKYRPVKAPELGICKEEEVWDEPLLWVYARKPVAR